MRRVRHAGGAPLDADWAAPFESFEASQTIPDSDSAWDASIAPRALRILTVNMHGRPVDMAHRPRLEITRHQRIGAPARDDPGRSVEGFEPAEGSLECDDEYHLANAQERRMRGLFEWLDALPTQLQPHILCLQEVIWRPMVEIAERELSKRGFVTWPGVSLTADDGCRTCVPPRAGSGLGVYVQSRAGLTPIDGDRLVFGGRLGTDWLVEKGLKWIAIKTLSKVLLVATLHPQAYNELAASSPAGEGLGTSLLRGLAGVEMWWRGSFPLAITAAHRHQYEQAATYLRDVALPRARAASAKARLPLGGFFIGGDLNVNRYAATPGSMEESDPARAAEVGLGREFRAALLTLGCRPPRIVREKDPRLATPFGGRFTWDGVSNSVAAPVVPSDRPALAWIDSVLTCGAGAGLPEPRYIDNRAVRLRLAQPCPELAPFWMTPCRRWRQRSVADGSAGPRARSYLSVNRACAYRLALGRAQLHRLVHLFLQTQEPTACPPMNERQRPAGRLLAAAALVLLADPNPQWADFVRRAPHSMSSQVWKGLEHYGLRPTDLHAAAAANIPIGSPHPFRMFSDVTDHYGVLAHILF